MTKRDTPGETRQPSTVRLLEIAHSNIEENVYLGINATSFDNILEEIMIATEGLGDLSFCLEAPALDLSAQEEIPRAPSEVTAAESHRVYEEIIIHRLPKADPIIVSQLAAANYFRFVSLQNRRKNAEESTMERELGKEEHETTSALPEKKEKEIGPAHTIFHDSGVGTSHRHESSYARSIMDFAKRNDEQSMRLLSELPKQGVLGALFKCNVCLHQVQFNSDKAWR